jgi:thiol-disulfide isomerase/thioredoxin
LTPPGLRGKIVLIDFWTYTCVNWRRTLPYVRAWSAKYKDHGLEVIGAHTPEFSFEHNVDNIRWAIKDMKIDYPIAIDSDYAIWNAFGNEYWQTGFGLPLWRRSSRRFGQPEDSGDLRRLWANRQLCISRWLRME